VTWCILIEYITYIGRIIYLYTYTIPITDSLILLEYMTGFSSLSSPVKSIENVHFDSSTSKYDTDIHILIEFLCFHLILNNSALLLALHNSNS